MTITTYKAILSFWFGEINDELSSSKHRRMWYSSSSETDGMIIDRFKDTLFVAAKGQYPHWQDGPHGRLALIILFDQMSRNIFRGSAEAFAYDQRALALCLEGVNQGSDKSLCLTERLFFYHPLEHAESLAAQHQCVQLMETLVKQYSGRQQEVAINALTFAKEQNTGNLF